VSPEAARRTRAAGVAYAAVAYLTWGLFPLYFRALKGVPAPEVLAHRITWSAGFLLVVVTALRRWGGVAALVRAPRTLGALALSATLISTNWLVYIWAVNAGHVVEASLGYFVNPIVTVLLGVAFLRDRLSARQWVAVALAAAGVLSLVLRAGHVPWIALTLAVTFGLYGLVRKRVRADPVDGLLVEVGLLAPLGLAFELWLASRGESHFRAEPRFTALLAASGVVTAMPLIWFANAVSRLRLSTVGILQYLNPTAQLAIAVFAFGEPFGAAHAVAFGFIWAALGLYTADLLGRGGPPAAR
jgi:chloramphenicol-sensitive protein RarD